MAVKTLAKVTLLVVALGLAGVACGRVSLDAGSGGGAGTAACMGLAEATCNGTQGCSAQVCSGCYDPRPYFVRCYRAGDSPPMCIDLECPVLPSCSTLDETTCKARPDCFAQECPSCFGNTTVSCYPAGVSPLSCVPPPCPYIPMCSMLDDATCSATPGCTSVRCPDCKGGQVYAGCAGPADRIGCGPCPPTCTSLDESACTLRVDCRAGYCNWCQQRMFVGCGDPGTAFGCPTGGPTCPAAVPCAAVTDQLSCDARSDCHSVFVDNSAVCDCATAGCCMHFTRCADGGKAACKGPTGSGVVFCMVAPPGCDGHAYVTSYTDNCYEGCVRQTECAP